MQYCELGRSGNGFLAIFHHEDEAVGFRVIENMTYKQAKEEIAKDFPDMPVVALGSKPSTTPKHGRVHRLKALVIADEMRSSVVIPRRRFRNRQVA